MGIFATLMRKILSGTSDANLDFASICRMLAHLGFAERVKGSHHIFTKESVQEIINIRKRSPYAVMWHSRPRLCGGPKARKPFGGE